MTGIFIQGAPFTLQRFGTSEGTGSERAILLLHGFPGEINKQNQDIAEFLACALRVPTYVLHYGGLGQGEGKFSFKDSIEDAVGAARFLIEDCGHRRLDLVGHSWGGLAALNVLRQIGVNVNRVALLSPLTKIISPELARHIVVQFQTERPGFFLADSTDQILDEIEQIREKLEPVGFIGSLKLYDGQLLVVQAIHDLEVPPQLNRDFATLAGKKARYVEVLQSHTFLEDRRELFQLIFEHLSGGCGEYPC